MRLRIPVLLLALATLVGALSASAANPAAEIDVPLRHWQAPLTWAGSSAPASGHLHLNSATASAGVQALALPSEPAQLVAINPCRIIDTRPGFSAAYTPGVPIPGGAVTTFALSSAPFPCNTIPSNAVAYSLNVTVAAAPGSGYLSAFPGSTAPNPLTSLVDFAAGQTIANASVVAGDSNGLVGFLPSTAIDFVVDINGYYAPGTSNSSVPTGTILPFGGATAPAGFLMCDGSEQSRTTYAALFSAISANFGAGNAINTFNLPDLQGRFLRGVTKDITRDPDFASRIAMGPLGNTGGNVGSVQSDDFLNHTHNSMGSGGSWCSGCGYYDNWGTSYGYFNNVPTGATGGNETRPKNAFVNFIIKY